MAETPLSAAHEVQTHINIPPLDPNLDVHLPLPVLQPPNHQPSTVERLAQGTRFTPAFSAAVAARVAELTRNPANLFQHWFDQRIDGEFASGALLCLCIVSGTVYFCANYLIPAIMLFVVLGAPNSTCNENVIRLVRGEAIPIVRRIGTLAYVGAAIFLFLTWDETFPLLPLWQLQYIPTNPTFLRTAYYTLAVASITRLCIVGIKLCITQLLPSSFLKPTLAVLEHSSMLYRTTLPIQPWLAFLNTTYESSSGLALLSGLYLCYHAAIVFKILRDTQQLWPYFTGSRLPYGKFVRQAPATKECPICLDATQVPIQLTKCQHVFCQACVERWLESNHSCPVCRAEIELHGMTFQALTGHTATTIIDCF
eukprot:m.266910 g.266910  ORF g.266910 m.266910 type:complete len:368 (-) comp17631_c0_seq2:3394-4497(-)